jgi:hypothetical protein
MAHRKPAHQKSKESGLLSLVPKNSALCNLIVNLWTLWTAFITIILFLRIVIIAFSIDITTNFAPFVLETSNKLLFPLRGILEYETSDFSRYLDISAVFAIIFYLSILWAVKTFVVSAENHNSKSNYVTTRAKIVNSGNRRG